MNDIIKHRQAVQENIQKAFEVGFDANAELEKARYVDNARNRKLGRVGLEYGGKKKEEEKKGDGDKKPSAGAKSGKEIFESFDVKTQRKLLKIFKEESAQVGDDRDPEEAAEIIDYIKDYLDGGDFFEAEDIAQEYHLTMKQGEEVVKHLLKLEMARLQKVVDGSKKKAQ